MTGGSSLTPWAQRDMLKMCDDLWPELYARPPNDCTILKFKEYQLKQRKKFPSRDFYNDVHDWVEAASRLSSWTSVPGEKVWLDNGRVNAWATVFSIRMHGNSPPDKVLQHGDLWEKYVEWRNSRSSVTASGAWHTSTAWSYAELQVAAVDSTVQTIIISAACGWFGVFLFTFDAWAATLVVTLVLAVIAGLCFFMVVLMGWAVGAVEILSLVIFVGYSVTYSLHIAHNYGKAEEEDDPFREQYDKTSIYADRESEEDGRRPNQAWLMRRERVSRTRLSVGRIGGATLSSAMSTILSSLILLDCTMRVFTKIGKVIIAVTTLSILCALVALPATLGVLGSSRRSCASRMRRRS